MSRTVELHQAFLWTCEDCGRDSFARAVTLAPESIAEDDREAIEQAGFDPDSGAFLKAPDSVTCGHCGATFETEEP